MKKNTEYVIREFYYELYKQARNAFFEDCYKSICKWFKNKIDNKKYNTWWLEAFISNTKTKNNKAWN